MSALRRLAALIREDFLCLWPGGGAPLNREALLRLLLYVCFLTLVVRLAWPLADSGWNRSGPAAPLPRAPQDQRAPVDRAPAEPDVQIEDPVNI
jgi:hypothetical protein